MNVWMIVAVVMEFGSSLLGISGLDLCATCGKKLTTSQLATWDVGVDEEVGRAK